MIYLKNVRKGTHFRRLSWWLGPNYDYLFIKETDGNISNPLYLKNAKGKDKQEGE